MYILPECTQWRIGTRVTEELLKAGLDRATELNLPVFCGNLKEWFDKGWLKHPRLQVDSKFRIYAHHCECLAVRYKPPPAVVLREGQKWSPPCLARCMRLQCSVI